MVCCGFDAGTYNLVCCTRDEKNNFSYRREVNAFLEIPLEDKFIFNMMKNSGVPLIERNKVAYALGESAVRMAYSMSDIELRRPMKDGCVNPKERDAFEIMNIMIHSLLDPIKHDKEVLYYTVPANALNEETDADYHGKILQAIFNAYESEKGFKCQPFPINEGLALVYAELASKQYTGIGISCLCPGTKIYTKDGIKNIEEIVEGDLVLTHKGRWRSVYGVVKKNYQGESTTIQANGYSGGIEDYKFVDNHELYVKKNDEWQWIGCEEIKINDIVGEPVIQFNEKPIGISLEEKITCSKLTTINTISISEKCCELIGYFLGDGSVGKCEGCIQFDFANKEIDNIDRVQYLIKQVFDKPSTQTIKSDNCTRIKCYSAAIAKWFAKNCYKDNKKKCPLDIGSLSENQCYSMLRGLIMSDGRVAKEAVYFYNTNSELAMLVKHLFSKIGIAACISHRKPRKGGIIEGRQITGKFTKWTVNTSSKNSFDKLNNILQCGLRYPKFESKKKWIEDDFCCSYVRNIQKEKYDGIVYDLQVTEDHSFSGPFMTIKNCGAGMVNVCHAIFGAPVFQFSIVNSGDWIDKMAAKATGESITFINQEKTKINLSESPKTLVERAIQTQYRIMLEKTVQTIKKGIAESGKRTRSDQPLDIVIAGGTSIPSGFDLMFREVITQTSLPIPIGSIVRPTDPLYSVSRGALIAAENSQQ